MKLNVKILLIGMNLFLTGISQAQQHDTIGRALEINSATITGTLPSIGDTVQLLVQLEANVTDSVRLHLGFPGGIAPPDQGSSETDRIINLAVEADSTYNLSIPMKMYSYGSSMLEIYATPKENYPDLENTAYASLDIEHSSALYRTLNNVHDSASVEITNHIGGPVSLSISGKVTYYDYRQGRIRGVYGVKVLLLFHRYAVTGTTTPCVAPTNLNFSHPVGGLIGGVGLTSPGTHYCVTDAEGNFSFNFASSFGNWNIFTDAVLLVSSNNDGCWLGEPVSTYIVRHPTGGSFTNFHTLRNTEGKCYATPNSNVFNLSNVEIRTSSKKGAILRYTQIANEFYGARPIGTSPDPIKVIYNTGRASGWNWFWRTNPPYVVAPYLEFDSPMPSIQIVAHEYGHYANWNSWGNTFSPAPGTFLEGWANFYSYAVQNYANANYDDYLYWKWNSEEWPFGNPRYGGYPINLDPNGYEIPHGFLWNVYDAYDDEGFKADGRDGLDNDDIGNPLLIFETEFPASPNNNIEGFKDALIAAVGGGEEGESIQDIYDFVYGGDTPDPMRPAQITELSGEVTGHNGLAPEITLTWEHRAYNSVFFQNPPTGVNIYQDDDNGGWTFVTMRSFPNVSKAFFTNTSLPSRYKVTSCNATGESFDAPVVTVPISKIATGSNSIVTPSYSLSASPNPFDHETKITLKLEAPAYGVIQVFDLLGREVDAKQFHELRSSSVDFNFKTESANQQYLCKVQIHFGDGTHREESFTIVSASR